MLTTCVDHIDLGVQGAGMANSVGG